MMDASIYSLSRDKQAGTATVTYDPAKGTSQAADSIGRHAFHVAAYLTDSTSTPEMVTRTYTARDWTTPTTVHYLYANSVYNGILSVGTTVAFCGATGITATHRRDEITCDACKAEIGL